MLVTSHLSDREQARGDARSQSSSLLVHRKRVSHGGDAKRSYYAGHMATSSYPETFFKHMSRELSGPISRAMAREPAMAARS